MATSWSQSSSTGHLRRKSSIACQSTPRITKTSTKSRSSSTTTTLYTTLSLEMPSSNHRSTTTSRSDLDPTFTTDTSLYKKRSRSNSMRSDRRRTSRWKTHRSIKSAIRLSSTQGTRIWFSSSNCWIATKTAKSHLQRLHLTQFHQKFKLCSSHFSTS